MKKEELLLLVTWLNQQIDFTSKLIEQAHLTKNYGKEVQYLAMKEAFSKCLGKLNNKEV